MNKRRNQILLLIVGLFLALGGMGLMWHVSNEEDVERKAARIKPGMAKREAHAMIGCPPGDYRTQQVPRVVADSGPPRDLWQFDDGDIQVQYGILADAGKCAAVFYRESPSIPWKTPRDVLVRWFPF
jgi:hypothetical protein